MKILLVSLDTDNHASGSAICFWTLSRMLSKHGHSCVLVTSNPRHGRVVEQKRNLTIIRINKPHHMKEIEFQLNTFLPDALVAQHTWGEQVFRHFRKNDVTKICLIKGAEGIETKQEYELLKLFGIDVIFVCSRHDQQMYEKRRGIYTHLAYPLVDINNYIVMNSHPQFITMVNYQKRKGGNTFRKIARRLPKEQFLAVRGWITIKPKYIRQTGNLTIVGPYKDMRTVYAKTRLLLVPSIWKEPFGRVILEAMANGIPVVASNVGGIPEAIEDGGVLVDDYRDPDVWIREIRKFDDLGYYAMMKRRSLERIRRYDLEHEYHRMEIGISMAVEKRKDPQYVVYYILRKWILRIIRYIYFHLKYYESKV